MPTDRMIPGKAKVKSSSISQVAYILYICSYVCELFLILNHVHFALCISCRSWISVNIKCSVQYHSALPLLSAISILLTISLHVNDSCLAFSVYIH